MLPRQVLERLLMAAPGAPWARVIYLGDGANDACPAARLVRPPHPPQRPPPGPGLWRLAQSRAKRPAFPVSAWPGHSHPARTMSTAERGRLLLEQPGHAHARVAVQRCAP